MRIIRLYIRFYSIKLLYLIAILLVVFGSYSYTMNQLSIGNKALLNPFIYLRNNTKFGINHLDFFIFAFILSSLFIIMLTLFYSMNYRAKTKLKGRYLTLYYKMVIAELFKEDEEQDNYINISRLEKFSKKDLGKELIISTFVQIHDKTTGIIRKKTERLVQLLHYKKFIQDYLYSPFYKHKKMALEAISEFKIEGYEKYTMKLIKQTKNELLHTDALISMIRLNCYESLITMANTNIKFTMWDINMIIKNIEKDNCINIPYNELINATNEGMQLLGIILARRLNKKELKRVIKNKAEHAEGDIKDEAILTFTSFAETQSDFKFLKNKYIESSDSTKSYIIKKLNRNPNREQVADFYEWIIINESMPNKLTAISNLLSVDISRIIRLKQSEDRLVRMACEHVIDINN